MRLKYDDQPGISYAKDIIIQEMYTTNNTVIIVTVWSQGGFSANKTMNTLFVRQEEYMIRRYISEA